MLHSSRRKRRGQPLVPPAPSRLALEDAVYLEVLDRRRTVAEACFTAGGSDLLAPGLGLFARIPSFEDAHLSVVALCGYVEKGSWRRRVADSETFPHLVVLVGRDSRLDDPRNGHVNLLVEFEHTTRLQSSDRFWPMRSDALVLRPCFNSMSSTSQTAPDRADRPQRQVAGSTRQSTRPAWRRVGRL